MRPALAQYFDGWYADMAASSVKDEIHQRHLGLPPGLLSNSLLTWPGIAEVTEALRLSPGATLADLACGRGGYGLEIAGRTNARLTGVELLRRGDTPGPPAGPATGPDSGVPRR